MLYSSPCFLMFSAALVTWNVWSGVPVADYENHKHSLAQRKKLLVVDWRLTTHNAGELDGTYENSARKRFSVVDRSITYEVGLQLTNLNVQD